MPMVRYADGTSRPVKNLGWLMRNAPLVKSITVRRYVRERGGYEAELNATLVGGTKYRCLFADFELAKLFVGRRRFAHAQIKVIDNLDNC